MRLAVVNAFVSCSIHRELAGFCYSKFRVVIGDDIVALLAFSCYPDRIRSDIISRISLDGILDLSFLTRNCSGDHYSQFRILCSIALAYRVSADCDSSWSYHKVAADCIRYDESSRNINGSNRAIAECALICSRACAFCACSDVLENCSVIRSITRYGFLCSVVSVLSASGCQDCVLIVIENYLGSGSFNNSILSISI